MMSKLRILQNLNHLIKGVEMFTSITSFVSLKNNKKIVIIREKALERSYGID